MTDGSDGCGCQFTHHEDPHCPKHSKNSITEWSRKEAEKGYPDEDSVPLIGACAPEFLSKETWAQRARRLARELRDLYIEAGHYDADYVNWTPHRLDEEADEWDREVQENE